MAVSKIPDPNTGYIASSASIASLSCTDANNAPCGWIRGNCEDTSNLPGGYSGKLWFDVMTVRENANPSNTGWGYGIQMAVLTSNTAADTWMRVVNNSIWGSWKRLDNT